MCGDVLQAGVPSQCREQKGAHFSCDANAVLQSIVQVIAKSEDRRISDFVAELRGAVQPVRVIDEAILRLPKSDRASERFFVLFLRFGRLECHVKRRGMERRPHDVAVERDDGRRTAFRQ